MRRFFFFLLAAGAVLTCTDTATESAPEIQPAFGVEPSPFAPINQLRAVESHLVGMNARFDRVFSDEGPNDEDGIVDQLGSMAHQLGEQNLKVVNAISTEEPEMPVEDFEAALFAVEDQAIDIFAKAGEKMGVEPSPFSPVIMAGLGEVASGANVIILTISDFTGPVCSDNPCDPTPGCCIPCTASSGGLCCQAGCPGTVSGGGT